MRAINHSGFNSNQLWKKLSAVASRAGRELVEKTLWLHYAAQQPQTPVWARTVIYGALAYFVMPLDAIPDLLPAVGLTDDLAALTAAIATVSMYIDDDVKSRTRQRMRQWFADAPGGGEDAPPGELLALEQDKQGG